MAKAPRPSFSLGKALARLRDGSHLSDAQVEGLIQCHLKPEQQCAVVVGLSLLSDRTDSEYRLLDTLRQNNQDVASLASSESNATDSGLSVPVAWRHAYSAVREGRSVGPESLQHIVHDIVAVEKAHRWAAGLMMLICAKGLGAEDTKALTDAMANSGATYDYRQCRELKHVRFIRRYPTGALSEKTALILPALIGAARATANVCSPFLVARSLGHTGGTWDKLSAIPGFKFPLPGDETVRALLACGIAMTVAHGDVNPADRIMYQLRSATGTVESIPLIVSSIASKQLSFPVHRLLLDVRMGADAFLKTKDEATKVGDLIASHLEPAGVTTTFTLTENTQPDGSTIGNALEVSEAIRVMGGGDYRWDERGIIAQRLIVLDFFTKLMAAEFLDKTAQEWSRIALQLFQSGAVLEGFAGILRAHGVPPSTIEDLFTNPFRALTIPEPYPVVSKRSGVLRSIDQTALGEIVYRELGAGANMFQGTFSAQSGIVLSSRLGDFLRAGDTLCFVYQAGPRQSEIPERICNCFQIR